MKFGIAKLPKTFKKQKKQQQTTKLNRGEKSKHKYLLRWKSFITWQIVILKIKIKHVSITIDGRTRGAGGAPAPPLFFQWGPRGL